MAQWLVWATCKILDLGSIPVSTVLGFDYPWCKSVNYKY